MPGFYELSKSDNGQFHFALKAENGQILLRSEQYESRGSAKGGIASVQTNCPLDARYEKKDATDGRSFFNLKAGNHQVIGTSKMFASAQERDAAIASVKENGATKAIKDIH
ncbi:MAG: YegP family protein [Gammaproteobacteria bacterium]